MVRCRAAAFAPLWTTSCTEDTPVPASAVQPVSPLSKPGLLGVVARAASKLAATGNATMAVVTRPAITRDFTKGAVWEVRA